MNFEIRHLEKRAKSAQNREMVILKSRGSFRRQEFSFSEISIR